MKLTSEQRDNRDQLSAGASITMAHEGGKLVGIAVDDKRKQKRMVKRVLDIVRSRGLKYTIERGTACVDVVLGDGRVRIVAVLRDKP